MIKKLLTFDYLSQSVLLIFCLVSVSGALVYRLYSLNRLGIALSLILALIFFIIIQYFYLISNKNTRRPLSAKTEPYRLGPVNFIFYILYFIFAGFCFYILFIHQTESAIVSPWQAVPLYFLAAYFSASLALIANILINKKFVLPLIALHYFLSFSIALIIYRLGYGYDSFIHQATEELISQAGAVEPKPFYYLGQYSLIIIFHKVFSIPLAALDKILVPLAAALALPVILWRVLKEWFDSRRLILLVILSLLALSFPFFIVTTPQNLAYLFLLLAILLGLTCKNLYDFSLIAALSSAAAVSQPVAGVPALILMAFLAIYHSDGAKIKKYFYPLLFILSASALPALFYFLNRRLPGAAASAEAPDGGLTRFIVPGQENFILNFVYLYGFNLKYIIGALAAAGAIIAYRHRDRCRILIIYALVWLSLILAYALTDKLPFAFLINYEQGDYARRIFLASAFFLLPFIILAVYYLADRAARSNNFVKISLAVFLAALITSSLYISYPRYDNYFNSRGYSVSRADLEAVSLINQNSAGDFIVLANQQTSAAALKRFGFKKYYGGADGRPIFYYPIPTSSPLYQHYLDMVYKKPSRETMSAAMDLAGVKEGYFILNKYWRASKKIIDEAKLSADSWQTAGEGEVYVFKYEK
ncbi:MAG: hypothetical protein Q8O93_00125 [bacterium]|nr:hypothetical protein [bacterium]